MEADNTFSSVVLPVPVPPEMRMFILACTMADSSSASVGVSERLSIRSLMVSGTTEKRRIDNSGPSSASGGMMAFTREPSGKRASTMGLDSSTRRPMRDTILSMIFIRWALSENTTSVSSSLPRRSTNTCEGPLTRMSDTVGSASKGSSGPRPMISSWMSSTMRLRSCAFSAAPASSSRRSTSMPSSSRRRSGFMLLITSRSMRPSNCVCSLFLSAWYCACPVAPRWLSSSDPFSRVGLRNSTVLARRFMAVARLGSVGLGWARVGSGGLE